MGVAQNDVRLTGNADTSGPQKTAAIGVLAYRGPENAVTEWQPLANYLTDTVEGWIFEVVPVTLSSVEHGIEHKQIEFLITNPGHFVTLAQDHHLSAIATRERWAKSAQEYLSSFGTTIFVARDSRIASLNDIKGKSVAAVSPEAFGGFQIAWNEMQKQGVDVFRDLESLRFLGFPHDQIITAVDTNEVQVGIVRSGLLERLADEGKIDLNDFRVLNLQKNRGMPHQISSAMYPEWPFVARSSTDKDLRENVMKALIETQNRAIALEYGLQDIWSAPLSYESPRKLISAYQFRVASVEGQAVVTPSFLVVLAAIVALSIFSFAFYRRRIGLSQRTTTENTASHVPEEFRKYEGKLKSLTVREKEVLNLICCGRQTKNIAIELGISPKTVEFHRANLLQKTEAGTMTHLVQIATRLGYDLGVSLGQNAIDPNEVPS